MTADPFPIELLTGGDKLALLAAYQLDLSNPDPLSNELVRSFRDHAVIGASSILWNHASLQSWDASFWTCDWESCLVVRDSVEPSTGVSASEFTQATYASLNDLSGFELLEWSSEPSVYQDFDETWSLFPSLTYTTKGIYCQDWNETSSRPGHWWSLTTSVFVEDHELHQYVQAGSELFDHRCHISPFGRVTARALLQDLHARQCTGNKKRGPRSRGRPREHDPLRDARIADAWKLCGARSYSRGANLLQARFPGITGPEIYSAIERDRHRPHG